MFLCPATTAQQRKFRSSVCLNTPARNVQRCSLSRGIAYKASWCMTLWMLCQAAVFGNILLMSVVQALLNTWVFAGPSSAENAEQTSPRNEDSLVTLPMLTEPRRNTVSRARRISPGATTERSGTYTRNANMLQVVKSRGQPPCIVEKYSYSKCISSSNTLQENKM